MVEFVTWKLLTYAYVVCEMFLKTLRKWEKHGNNDITNNKYNITLKYPLFKQLSLPYLSHWVNILGMFWMVFVASVKF